MIGAPERKDSTQELSPTAPSPAVSLKLANATCPSTWDSPLVYLAKMMPSSFTSRPTKRPVVKPSCCMSLTENGLPNWVMLFRRISKMELLGGFAIGKVPPTATGRESAAPNDCPLAYH